MLLTCPIKTINTVFISMYLSENTIHNAKDISIYVNDVVVLIISFCFILMLDLLKF